MSLKPLFPINAIYAWAVSLVFLFVMVFLWFICYAVIMPIRAGVTSNMVQFENMTSYASWPLADLFMANVWIYFLVISSIAVLLWVFHYTQRKGEMFR